MEIGEVRSLGTRDGREWFEVHVTIPNEARPGRPEDQAAFVDGVIAEVVAKTSIRCRRLGWADDTKLWIQGPKAAGGG